VIRTEEHEQLIQELANLDGREDVSPEGEELAESLAG